MTWRSSVMAARPPASTASSASPACSGEVFMILRAAPAWMIITLTLCVTTSCSSRAILARSCSTARRSASACSRSRAESRVRPSSVRSFQVRRPTAATAIGTRMSRAMYWLGTIGATEFPDVPTRATDTGSAARVATRYGLYTAALYTAMTNA